MIDVEFILGEKPLQPSSKKRRRRLAVWLDRAALAGLAAGFGLYMQPWWQEGLRVGFFMTFAFTILHIVTSRLPGPEEP